MSRWPLLAVLFKAYLQTSLQTLCKGLGDSRPSTIATILAVTRVTVIATMAVLEQSLALAEIMMIAMIVAYLIWTTILLHLTVQCK